MSSKHFQVCFIENIWKCVALKKKKLIVNLFKELFSMKCVAGE